MGVPDEVVLHEGDAFAFHGMGDDDGRTPGSLLGQGAGLQKRLDVMAVGFEGAPAEGLPLGRQVGRGPLPAPFAEVGPGELGQPIVVNYGGEVVQTVAGGHLRRFPDLSLLYLAVTQQDPGAEREAP